jgi:glycosyltransferase involved in cell wall biosynthesis
MITDVPLGPYYHYCSQLANGLQRNAPARIEMVSLFADTKRGMAADEAAFLDPAIPCSVLDPGKCGKPYRLLGLAFNLGRFLTRIARQGNTVVHLHAPSGIFLLDAGFLLALRLAGAVVIRTLHELTAVERFGAASGLQRHLAGLQLRLAHHIIVHDQKTADRLAKEFRIALSRMTVVPHGNYLVFRKFLPDRHSLATPAPDDPPVVLFQGIKRHKGIEVFLAAVHLLNQRGCRFKALITGQINPGDEDLIRVIKATPNVALDSRYVPSSELWQVYTKAAMVVMPYLKGTTSGAVHLAFAFSRPVIASDLDCFRPLVSAGETGLISPAGDAAALATTIQSLLENPAAATAYGRRGFELVSGATYDWDRIAGVTAAAYRQGRDPLQPQTVPQ